MKELISIIIPCYNIAGHLPKCISSILTQTYKNFELILIDDGSQDETLGICEEYQKRDSRIKIFTHPNKGVSYTRNRGIELAEGLYIMFIDGDDWVKEDYIASIYDEYDDGLWPISGMINVRKKNVKNNENLINLLLLYPNKIIPREHLVDSLKHYIIGTPCACIYRKSILIEKVIFFDENISYQEDLLFNLEYVKHIDYIKLISYYGYYYMEHVVSSSSRYHKNFDHIEVVYNKLKEIVIKKEDSLVVKDFILQASMKKIANIFHSASPKNNTAKLKELKEIFSSVYFSYSLEAIDNASFNRLLKFLLKKRSPKLIYCYYNFLHSLKN